MTELLSFEKSRPNAHGPRLPDAEVNAPGPQICCPASSFDLGRPACRG